MPLAICLSSIVLPAFGGETISPRWPLPIGATRLIRRWLRFFGSVSRLISSTGKIGVRSSKTGRRRAVSGSTPLTASTRSRPKYFSRLARGADRAGDAVAGAQAEAADLARADVDVVRARQQAVAAQEAEAVVDDVEDAGGVVVAGALGLALEDAVDEVVLAVAGGGVELEVAADLAELGDAHLAEVA